MARVGFLLKAIFISYVCSILTLALPSSSYFPQNATTTWKNDESSLYTIHFSDDSLARFIILQEFDALFGYGFCFYCNNSTTDSCHLSIIFYFSYYDFDGATAGLENEESCKQACLRDDASCMAAFFLNTKSNSKGYCYLVSEVLSIIGTPLLSGDLLGSSSHIKVKIYSTPLVPLSSSSISRRTLSIVFSACAFVLLCIFASLLLLKRNKARRDKLYLRTLSETLLRFSYNELSITTQNFSQKLGGGGFGLVFKGTLTDGREVAVKRLGNDGQGKKEFLAEVETVGKIHHINLVRLIGFCVENEHLILVYEYMANGSLEKWIFYENQNASLDWKLRKKIVLDIAKGLAYIHEECVQRIAHLDMKPHNILLDDNFNAKVSDFGMSKLIDRGKSQVVTGMRGTLGYLAPEWQGSRITVKADVYSFGILVLEVVSGRKIRDYSQPESKVHLLKVLKKKCLENQLIDIVDSRSEDMVSNCEDAVHIIRLAMWCLHSDYKRRPEMSSVVKVLEGSLELESNISYNFASIFSPPCPHSNINQVSGGRRLGERSGAMIPREYYSRPIGGDTTDQRLASRVDSYGIGQKMRDGAGR